MKFELSPVGPPIVTKYRNAMRPLAPAAGRPDNVIVNSVQTSGYPPTSRFGLTDSKRVVKSPTAVEPVPTLVLAPLVDKRTSNLSGNGLSSVVRVQNLTTSPLLNVRFGVSSQLLMVFVPPVLLNLHPF